MCGLVGIFTVKGLGGFHSALQAANDIVAHRGPDGSGFVLFNTKFSETLKISGEKLLLEDGHMDRMTLAFGHRRLAIIDLSTAGHQPMCNEDESIWITYNGEVYNYVELRAELEKAGHTFRSQSDTEVILHAYEEWGENCVSRFNGMWAFAIADLNKQQLFCSRDRFGIKPFHYYYDGRRFVFGSEIKQLLCFPFVRKRVNERAVYEFLAYGAVDYCDETFFGDIYQLRHGHNLKVDLRDASLITTAFYTHDFRIDNRITFREAAAKFRRLLTDSVRLRLRSDVEVGSCMSGGLDSSSIVCLMNQLLKDQRRLGVQRTFSSHFEEEEANELEYMQEVIRATGVKSYFTYPTPDQFLRDLERLVWHQEEPFGSTSIFAQWSVFKLAHDHGMKVMLDGQGADEQLSGYVDLALYFFNELHAKRRWLKLAWETWRHTQLQGKPWLSLLPGGAGNFLRSFGFLKHNDVPSPIIDWIRPEVKERYQGRSYYLKSQQIRPLGELEHLNNTLYQLTFLNNLQELLKYEDRNSMAFSIESRLPFLDYRLVEFLFSLPSTFKIRNGYTKRVLRDGMCGVIPEKIRRRVGKLGFATPERLWQKTILRPLIELAIQDNSLRPFLIPEKAMSYLGQIQQYELADFAPWRWINLYLWMQRYDFA